MGIHFREMGVRQPSDRTGPLAGGSVRQPPVGSVGEFDQSCFALSYFQEIACRFEVHDSRGQNAVGEMGKEFGTHSRPVLRTPTENIEVCWGVGVGENQAAAYRW